VNFTPGKFYVVAGQGVCQCQVHGNGDLVFAPYDFRSDTFWGANYVSPEHVLREPTPEEIQTYKANVRERLMPKAERPVRTQTCNNPKCGHVNSEPGGRAGCPKCGWGYERIPCTKSL
jgi:hypothetical protein